MTLSAYQVSPQHTLVRYQRAINAVTPTIASCSLGGAIALLKFIAILPSIGLPQTTPIDAVRVPMLLTCTFVCEHPRLTRVELTLDVHAPWCFGGQGHAGQRG